MTIQTRSPASGATSYLDKAVTGTRTQLAGYLADLTDRGALVSMTAPQPVGSGRYRVVVRLRPTSRAVARTTPSADYRPVAGPTRPVQRPRIFPGAIRAVVIAATVATVLVALAAWLLFGVIVPAGTHLVAHYGMAALGIAVIAVILGALGVGTAVHHCPGCRHR